MLRCFVVEKGLYYFDPAQNINIIVVYLKACNWDLNSIMLHLTLWAKSADDIFLLYLSKNVGFRIDGFDKPVTLDRRYFLTFHRIPLFFLSSSNKGYWYQRGNFLVFCLTQQNISYLRISWTYANLSFAFHVNTQFS